MNNELVQRGNVRSKVQIHNSMGKRRSLDTVRPSAGIYVAGFPAVKIEEVHA